MFPTPTLIQGPTFILFDNFSRPYVYYIIFFSLNMKPLNLFFLVNILSIVGVLSKPTIVQDCFHKILLKKVACRDID